MCRIGVTRHVEEENGRKEERKELQASSNPLLEMEEEAIPSKQPHPILPYPALGFCPATHSPQESQSWDNSSLLSPSVRKPALELVLVPVAGPTR